MSTISFAILQFYSFITKSGNIILLTQIFFFLCTLLASLLLTENIIFTVACPKVNKFAFVEIKGHEPYVGPLTKLSYIFLNGITVFGFLVLGFSS